MRSTALTDFFPAERVCGSIHMVLCEHDWLVTCVFAVGARYSHLSLQLKTIQHATLRLPPSSGGHATITQGPDLQAACTCAYPGGQRQVSFVRRSSRVDGAGTRICCIAKSILRHHGRVTDMPYTRVARSEACDEPHLNNRLARVRRSAARSQNDSKARVRCLAKLAKLTLDSKCAHITTNRCHAASTPRS